MDKKLKDKNHRQIRAMKGFIVGLLEQMGCQPEINKEGDIFFKYQGEKSINQDESLLKEHCVRQTGVYKEVPD